MFCEAGPEPPPTGASLLQQSLVVLQAALSLVLLVGAGLFSQNLNKLQSMDLKLVSKNRYMVHINPQAAGYSQTQLEVLYRTMEERFHAVPGVVKVGISNYTPMEDNNWNNGIGVQGEPDAASFRIFHQGQCGLLRFGGNPCIDGTRNQGAGYFDCSSSGGGQPGVCEAILQGQKSYWTADRFALLSWGF